MKRAVVTGMILLMFLSVLSAQYYNRIIPFPFGNGNPTEISVINDTIYIPVIYPGNQSTLVRVIQNGIDYFHLNKFDFASQSSIGNGNDLFLYAKDRTKNKGLRLGKWNGVDTLEWMYDYETDGEYNLPNASTYLDKCIYIGFFMDHDNGDHREIGIKKIDTSGNEIWHRNFNTDLRYSYLFEIETALDNHILASSSILHYDTSGRYPKLFKLDQDGNEIWSVQSSEEVNTSGTTNTWIAPLNNGNIVQCYSLGLTWQEEDEYWRNGWNKDPIRLKWYNSEGQEIKRDLLINKGSTHDETAFRQLESGKGDYFFAYGLDNELLDYEYYGLVIKYSNDGDTIWKKRFRHPSFNRKRVGHVIKDIVELENGDLIMSGLISPQGEESEIWLMRTNADGCLSDEPCGDLVLTDIEEENISSESLMLYPNPTSQTFQLNLSLDAYSILTPLGQIVTSGENYKEKDYIDVASLQVGTYILKGVVQDQNISLRFVKH